MFVICDPVWIWGRIGQVGWGISRGVCPGFGHIHIYSTLTCTHWTWFSIHTGVCSGVTPWFMLTRWAHVTVPQSGNTQHPPKALTPNTSAPTWGSILCPGPSALLQGGIRNLWCCYLQGIHRQTATSSLRDQTYVTKSKSKDRGRGRRVKRHDFQWESCALWSP